MSTDYGQETLLASALRKLAAEKAAAAPYKPGPSLTQRNYGLGSGLNPALGKQPLQGPPKPAAAPQMPQGSISNQDVRKHFSGYKGPASFGVPRHVIESMRQADRSNGGKGEITWSSDNVPMIPGLAANDPRNDPRTYAQQPTIPTPNELRNQPFLAGERAALADPNRAAELQAEEQRMNQEMQQKAQATNARALAQTETPAQPVETASAAAPVSMNQADAGPLGWDAPLEHDPAGGFVDAMGGAADDALGTIGGMALNNFGPLSAIGKTMPSWGDAGQAMINGMQLRQSKPLSWPKTGMLKKAIGLGAAGRLRNRGGVSARNVVQALSSPTVRKTLAGAAGVSAVASSPWWVGPATDAALAAPGAAVDVAQDLGSRGLGLLSPNKGAQPAGAPAAKPTILDDVKTQDGSSLLGRFPIPVRDAFANMATTKGPEAVRSALQAQADVTPELGYDKQQYDRKLYNTLASLFGYGKWEAEKPTGAVDPQALAKSTLERVDSPMNSTANDYLQAAYNNPYATGAAGVGALGLGSLLASGRKAPEEEEEEAPTPRKRKKKTAADKSDPPPYFGFAAAGVGALGLADTLHKKTRRKKKVKEESPETEEYVIERKVAALLG